MKYTCKKCNIYFDYPKKGENGNILCPQCGGPATHNSEDDQQDTEKESGRMSSAWDMVATIVLIANIFGAIVACFVACQDGINWAMICIAVGETALVALFCGIVKLLASINTTLEVLGALHLANRE